MYKNGYGIDVNIDEAIKWLRLAAEQKNAYAALAFIKLNREYKLNYDMSKVVNSLIASAEKNSMSQYVLGYYYMFCESDKEQALFWLEQSAANGNEYAKNLIEYINNYNYYVSPAQAAINLVRNLGKIIEEDYQMKQKQFEMTDRKLLSKISQKKQALGHKQTLK